MKIVEDTFLAVDQNDTITAIRQTLASLQAEHYEKPRYLLVLEPSGHFLGIVTVAELEWSEGSDQISTQAELGTKRLAVPLDAPEAEKVAAVQAGKGLALAMKGGLPAAILRPQDLGFGGEFQIGSQGGLPPERGAAHCPLCKAEVSGFQTALVRSSRGFTYRRTCPSCRKVIPEPVG
jgi:hypothetical protein